MGVKIAKKELKAFVDKASFLKCTPMEHGPDIWTCPFCHKDQGNSASAVHTRGCILVKMQKLVK